MYNKNVLEKSPLMRHLFNKLNTDVTVSCNGERTRGSLITIDIFAKYIEVQVGTEVFFFNMRRIDYVRTKDMVIKNGKAN